MKTLLIQNIASLVSCDEEDRVYENVDLYAENGVIRAIGQNLDKAADETIDARHMLCYPGLINTHHHLYQQFSRNLPQVQNMELFDWLKTHDVNAAVILVIMVVVAVFNMATALLTLVLERTRMIGLLKTMGMNNASLRRIFLYRALMLILRGVVWGNAIGLGICLLQYYFHLIPLDPEGYMLSEVPVAFGVGWWLALNAGVVVVILTLLMLPASIISQVKPVEAIRYDS